MTFNNKRQLDVGLIPGSLGASSIIGTLNVARTAVTVEMVQYRLENVRTRCDL